MKIIERTNISTLLGIRFWDPVQDQQIRSGLVATAWRSGAPHTQATAFVTASGVYAFQGLAGMRAYETATEDSPAPAGTRPFTIAIKDLDRRFQSITLNLVLPLPYRGIYPSDKPTSPPEAALPGFYLFSAPNRTIPGVATIHAELVLANNGKPAAHARLIADHSGTSWFGLADERGRVTLLLPYPPFNKTIGASPPLGPVPEKQHWPVKITVQHETGKVQFPDGCQWPEINSVFKQSEQPLWLTPGGPPVSSEMFDLVWGQALVLRTGDLPVLKIGPA